MDVALENALARREDLKARITGLSEDIRELQEQRVAAAEELNRVQEFVATWYDMAGIEPPPTREQKEAAKPAPAPVERKPTNPNRRDVALKCVEYIREAKRPLSRGELYEQLLADNIIIYGKSPEMVLSTMLWRTKDVIRRLRGGGYWPVEDPLPAGHSIDIEDLMR